MYSWIRILFVGDLHCPCFVVFRRFVVSSFHVISSFYAVTSRLTQDLVDEAVWVWAMTTRMTHLPSLSMKKICS